MTKTKKHSTWRYRSPIRGFLRAAAQLLLLKPAVWSVLSVRVQNSANLDQLKKSQAFIIVANHASHFDAPLIVGSLPWRLARKLAIGAAADYFFKSWHQALPTRVLLNTFPVDRNGSTKYKGLAGQLLGERTSLLILPEGTRSRTGKIAPFKPGAAALAIKHRVPVLPIALVGAYEAWPPGEKKWRTGRPPVRVNFGEPLWPGENETIEQFNTRLRNVVIKLYKTVKDDSPEKS